MKHEDLTVLLTKLIENRCSDEETALANKLLEDEAVSVYFIQLIERRLIAESDEDEVDENVQEILDNRLQIINNKINEPNKAPRYLNWRIISVAAMFLIIAISALFFYTSKTKNNTEIAAIAQPVILPGSNKAILTLGNGRKIILDSAGGGEIARQSNTSIEKTDKGHLRYHSAASPNEDLPKTISLNTLSIPRGGQYQLVLADGTKVWLNAGSLLTYPTAFTDAGRVVELSGEAYFEVAKMPNKTTGKGNVPFIVKSKLQRIEVLGTGFNVNAYDDESIIRTTLLHGSVKVGMINGNTASSIAPKFLKPGEQSELSLNNIVVGEGNPEAATAWKNGLFQFEDEDLHVIMREIARWYDVDIEFSRKMENKQFSGTISKYSNVDRVLKMLTLTGSVSFEVTGRKIKVL